MRPESYDYLSAVKITKRIYQIYVSRSESYFTEVYSLGPEQ